MPRGDGEESQQSATLTRPAARRRLPRSARLHIEDLASVEPTSADRVYASKLVDEVAQETNWRPLLCELWIHRDKLSRSDCPPLLAELRDLAACSQFGYGKGDIQGETRGRRLLLRGTEGFFNNHTVIIRGSTRAHLVAPGSTETLCGKDVLSGREESLRRGVFAEVVARPGKRPRHYSRQLHACARCSKLSSELDIPGVTEPYDFSVLDEVRLERVKQSAVSGLVSGLERLACSPGSARDEIRVLMTAFDAGLAEIDRVLADEFVDGGGDWTELSELMPYGFFDLARKAYGVDLSAWPMLDRSDLVAALQEIPPLEHGDADMSIATLYRMRSEFLSSSLFASTLLGRALPEAVSPAVLRKTKNSYSWANPDRNARTRIRMAWRALAAAD